MEFSEEDIQRLFNEAPALASGLINEIYGSLEHGGPEAVNVLFVTKGTHNPHFKDRRAVIDFVVALKQFSGTLLTREEKSVLGNR